jgi:hypothetical protein
MSWMGMMRKAGIESDGVDIDVFRGNILANNLILSPGNVYYVDGSRASSGDGSRWSRAFVTLAEAIAVVRGRIDWGASPWGTRDIIMVAPGTYAENLTAMHHGGLMIGVGWDNRDAQFGVKIAPTTGYPVNVGGLVNAGFVGIGFESADASPAFYSGVLNNCFLLRCLFSGAAESVTCAAALRVNDAVRNRFEDCEWTCSAVGFDIAYVDAGDSFSHNRIIGGRMTQHTTAALRTSTNLVGPSSTVEGLLLSGSGQTLAIGVDDNSGILDLFNLRITATDPIQGCRSANACYGNGSLLNGSGE